MNFEQKLKKNQRDELWQEYCSFLDLSMAEYMQIQTRLMEEQINLWSQSGLGQKLLGGREVSSIEQFRSLMPLTTFADYADVLLAKDETMLPDKPVVWIETTWEGGIQPLKLAPYTRAMLDVYQNNVVSSLILATSREKGHFTVAPGDKTLYGFAPLPYATGLFPLLLNEEISLKYLPSLADGQSMSFGQRNREGFALGLHQGIDLFFGMSSVISYMTEAFMAHGSKRSGGKGARISLPMLRRFLEASYKSKRDERPLLPKDIFNLKALVCAGTDTGYYKDFLEAHWGIRPMEIAAGTEPTLIGTESWARNGLIFFPDACFYEFIPEQEMLKNLVDPHYQPRTCLMDELVPHENYELVISVLKGGVFARYRVGDVYRCLGVGGKYAGTDLPRLQFVDRIPSVIDIGGFTRITERSIEDVIELSGLKIAHWVAAKEYNQDNRPYLHLYVEMTPEAIESSAVSRRILVEHLSVYFKYFDHDYEDLERLLGVQPLQITILRLGTMNVFRCRGNRIRRINPPPMQIADLLAAQQAVAEPRAEVGRGSVAR